MIKKLRIKFIAASILALFIVLSIVLTGTIYTGYKKIVDEADTLLTILSANKGAFPDIFIPDGPNGIDNGRFMYGLSRETPFETRFFTVALSDTGEPIYTNMLMIAAVDSTTAVEYAQKAASSDRNKGFIKDYRYLVSTDYNTADVIFVDCGRSLTIFRSNIVSYISISLLGLSSVLILLIIFSGYIIKPVTEAYEKQKRFITDAGHELKTPITVINADSDVLELEMEGNEWLTDIRNQTSKLSKLTNDLIFLAKMDEGLPSDTIEFPLSDMIEDVISEFSMLIISGGKSLEQNIQPMVSYIGEEKSLRKLINVLLDNACKYSSDNGHIEVSMSAVKNMIRISVTNSTDKIYDASALNHLFDRFYRADASRNGAIEGFGLGLSMAYNIVSNHKGTIKASIIGDNDFNITVSLPKR